VQLKQSGWGTKVTLSVTRIPTAPVEEPQPAAAVEPEPGTEPELTIEPNAVSADIADTEKSTEPGADVEPDTPKPLLEAEPVATESDPKPEAGETKSEPETTAPTQPEPRLGFFARLFRKREPQPIAAVEPEPVASVEPEVEPEPEVVAMALPEPAYPERPSEPTVDLAAELASVEEQMAQETTELLTGVLDRLGAAHHRPFSRG
jgi:hypothetical protein